jgi:hypothetical protein
MRFYQLKYGHAMSVKQASNAPPNSAAIPLPDGLRNRTQGAELHCFFDVGGRFLDTKTNGPCCEGDLTPG